MTKTSVEYNYRLCSLCRLSEIWRVDILLPALLREWWTSSTSPPHRGTVSKPPSPWHDKLVRIYVTSYQLDSKYIIIFT